MVNEYEDIPYAAQVATAMGIYSPRVSWSASRNNAEFEMTACISIEPFAARARRATAKFSVRSICV
jgi:hypothetical protein